MSNDIYKDHQDENGMYTQCDVEGCDKKFYGPHRKSSLRLHRQKTHGLGLKERPGNEYRLLNRRNPMEREAFMNGHNEICDATGDLR